MQVGIEGPTADLKFVFLFEPPPLLVVPGTPVPLDLSGEVTGTHGGSINLGKLRMQYSGLNTSGVDAVVLEGIALSANPPPDAKSVDSAVATAKFPTFGESVNLDVYVNASNHGCRIRWPYHQVPAAP